MEQLLIIQNYGTKMEHAKEALSERFHVTDIPVTQKDYDFIRSQFPPGPGKDIRVTEKARIENKATRDQGEVFKWESVERSPVFEPTIVIAVTSRKTVDDLISAMHDAKIADIVSKLNASLEKAVQQLDIDLRDYAYLLENTFPLQFNIERYRFNVEKKKWELLESMKKSMTEAGIKSLDNMVAGCVRDLAPVEARAEPRQATRRTGSAPEITASRW